MTKITTKKEYYNIIIEILDKIYNMSNEENEKITGIKNKEQPYELVIKNILNEYCIENIKKNKKEITSDTEKNKYENMFFEYQPNGSQMPPDFKIYCEKFEEIKIECKSSKNNKPIWNCSIPEKETIYIYYNTKTKETFIFGGEEIVSEKIRSQVIKFNEELKILCNKFNETILCDENISYYSRQMINQIKKMNIILQDRNKIFNKVKNELLAKSDLEDKIINENSKKIETNSQVKRIKKVIETFKNEKENVRIPNEENKLTKTKVKKNKSTKPNINLKNSFCVLYKFKSIN